MSAVLITGSAGAGKSAIAAVLARRGLACIDDDQDPFLARFVDSSGAMVAEEPAEPDFGWLARHSWEWGPARLDELVSTAAPATLYLCGGADNGLELASRFTRVFLLEIDEAHHAGTAGCAPGQRGAAPGTLASTFAASGRDTRTACAPSGRFPSTPGSPSTGWWTRYSPTRRLA